MNNSTIGLRHSCNEGILLFLSLSLFWVSLIHFPFRSLYFLMTFIHIHVRENEQFQKLEKENNKKEKERRRERERILSLPRAASRFYSLSLSLSLQILLFSDLTLIKNHPLENWPHFLFSILIFLSLFLYLTSFRWFSNVKGLRIEMWCINIIKT